MQFVRNCEGFTNKLWRNQMFMVFSAFFIVTLGVITISNEFTIFEYAGNLILLQFTVINMYTIFMQYMYSITNE